MRRDRPIVRYCWLLGACALVGQWVYASRVGIDPTAHDRYAHDVRSIQALDARLNEQVMQSRQALVGHYDDLANTVTALRMLHARLEEPPRFLPTEERSEVLSRAQGASAALADKIRLVESFKSQNAIFRNSSRFFPVAARELRDKLKEGAAEPGAARVNELLLSVLGFVHLPSEDQLQAARRAYVTLEGTSLDASLEPDKSVVLLHAKTLLDRTLGVAELTNAVLSAPTYAAANTLDTAYGRGVHTAMRATEHRQSLMALTLLAVVALMATDFVQRFRRTARAERETADKLTEANATLVRDKEREAELSELKSRFVTMTSHEFRTPLSVILSSTELLEAYGERWLPAKRSDHYTRVKTAVGIMRELLDAVLVIGKSDAGRLECNPAPLDVARFVREAVESVASTSMRHELRIDAPESFPPAQIDEKLAVHILTNLLSNAVKYSPAGGPIDVAARAEGADLVISVSDRGIGIASEDLVRLFESFHRGKNVGTIPGTGLGLAVVKRAVTAHNGSIQVRSLEAEGTTFIVRLPVFELAAQRCEVALESTDSTVAAEANVA